MHAPPLLTDLVVVMALSVAVSTLFVRFRLPVIAGLLMAGVLVGPGAFGLLEDAERIEALAEIGVVLLLFTVGLELSIDQLRRIWRAVLLGGTLQVVLTAGAAFGVATAVGVPAPTAVLIGLFAAMSSTAIVLRALDLRGETEAPHGRLVIGVLIFQDLCVVPMMLAIPMLAGQATGAGEILGTIGRAGAVVAGTLVAGRWAVPWVLRKIAATGSRDLLLLAVAFVSLTAVWISAQAGLSLALGAFLGGLIVAGTPFGRQAISDALPLRTVFVGVFFASIGMLLDVPTILERPLPVFGLAAAFLVGKLVLAMAATMVMRLPVRTATLSGLALAQVGEFSFVLLGAGTAAGLVPGDLGRLLLAAAVITMFLAPALIAVAPRFAAGAERLGPLARAFGARSLEEDAAGHAGLEKHVIIAGFGTGGRLLAEGLEAVGTPYLVLDLNAESVRRAQDDGIAAYYGDVTSAEVLSHAGLARAAVFALVLSDPGATRRAVEVARGLVPDVSIVARSRFVAEEADFRQRGASQVVSAELESSIEVLAVVLRCLGTPRNLIEERTDAARNGGSAGSAVRRLTVPPIPGRLVHDLLRDVRIENHLLRDGDWAVGRTLAETDVRAGTGASIVALRRRSELRTNPGAEERLESGDILYFIGEPNQVRCGIRWIEEGPRGTEA
jgi:CPA2 family monovalent cation:H+ antiporter-2